ncbi:MAG TPA: hypothetical protein VEY11_03680 [Pyrinomonadaceae bacterium]|nr:hypothetical protein [Pyrinomonadaceae bacterium]
MRLVQALSFACLLLLLTAADAPAQRQRRTTPARRPAPATNAGKPTAASTTTLNEARIRLADELKTLTRFLYLYGRTSVNVEANEKQAREGGANVSPQAQAILDRSRTTVLGSLGNIRERLDKLELYFRTTPALAQHYTRLSGVAAAAASAEQRANAGQLDAAGRALIEVANQLADVLLDM